VNTDALLADLRSDEGWSPTLYKCTAGAWSLGFGFNVDPDHGGNIPKPVAEFWLLYEKNAREAALTKRWPPYATQPEPVQRALLNMAFQLGVNGVMGFPNMLRSLERGDRLEAAAHARDSEWRRVQTPARAERVCRLIEGT
jgi:lysozyme